MGPTDQPPTVSKANRQYYTPTKDTTDAKITLGDKTSLFSGLEYWS